MGAIDKMVPEVYQVFWSGLAAGEFITDAARAAGTYRKQGAWWLAEAGGVRPRRGRNLKGRCLTLAEREEIALGRARGESMRDIARALGRAPSTISRELSRNAVRGAGGHSDYRATSAHALAYERASRPKPAKLATNLALRAKVEADLAKKYSPEQIAGRLKVEFPDQPEMQVSTETIYQSLYVQSRGALKRDLTRCLRTGRAVRKPCRKPGQRKNRVPDMINIADRPAEAADRAVPGHWEGDLIIGTKNLSAIGTLVERSTNYTMLLHLPDGYTPELVRDALITKIKTLPDVLRASLTWDQGPEMVETGQHRRRHRHLFLRPARAVAARYQREHQRAAAPVFPEEQRLVRPLRGRPRLGRRRTQRPAPQTARLPQTHRATQRAVPALVTEHGPARPADGLDRSFTGLLPIAADPCRPEPASRLACHPEGLALTPARTATHPGRSERRPCPLQIRTRSHSYAEVTTHRKPRMSTRVATTARIRRWASGKTGRQIVGTSGGPLRLR